ncbi:FtsX-like permease family protein [Nonomuraea endophytica]|uniref:Putative ABC transport system permease protein n=1 Tax=Nonomuraea endophytica TaxID=714136 RepID=A0A7W8A2M3_9ACTN|nr:FtsX-like permease family protein [Nonomuraea endophytica]MBB5078362.1 putative ABC transport system permease protein [Nonomuraea endophytica]
MLTLALRSFAHHRTVALATGLVALVGTVLVSSMTSLLATGLAEGTATADRPFLTQFPLIMGGWVVAIVLFAMVSTIGVALGGRAGEIAGLRLIGATPRQVRLMIAVETLAVSTMAALPGLAGGYLLGWAVTGAIRDTGLIADVTVYAPGVLLPVAGTLVVMAASVVAAWFGSRSPAYRSPVADAAAPARRRTSKRPGRGRRVAGVAAIAAGLVSSAAVLAMDPASVLTTAMTGPGCVLVAAGLSTLAPEFLALVSRLLGAVRGRRGAAAHLAAINLSAAPDRVRPAATFLTLFTGIAAGTLSMQGIENAAGAGGGAGQLMASINYLVVVLISAFMAIALSNNLIASITRRRAEFSVMTLVGATRAQTLGMLVREVAAAAVVSVAAGGLGAFASVLPFAIVKTGDPLQAAAPLVYAGTIAAGMAVTVGVAVLAGRRTLRAA